MESTLASGFRSFSPSPADPLALGRNKEVVDKAMERTVLQFETLGTTAYPAQPCPRPSALESEDRSLVIALATTIIRLGSDVAQVEQQAAAPVEAFARPVGKLGHRLADKDEETPDTSGTQLREEVSAQQAAVILGVSKDTVLANLKGGVLPYRNIATPNSSRPTYRIPLDKVRELRKSYTVEPPATPPPPRQPTRRRAKATGATKYKHLNTSDD